MNEYCSLVRDLLPLYVDGLVEEGSEEFIGKHLQACADCRQQYKAMAAEVNMEKATPSDVRRPFLRIKRFYIARTLLVILVLAILAVPLCFGFNALRGQGVTFTSFAAASHANRAFDAVEEGDYLLAAEYFDDSERSQAFLRTLEALEQKGIATRHASASYWGFSLRGGVTSGEVIARMESDGERYDVYFLVGYQSGQITPWDIVRVSRSLPGHLPGYRIIDTLHRRSEWPEWLVALEQVLGTLETGEIP